MRSGTNLVPAVLTVNFRRSGDTTTPQQAVATLDATTGVNITRDANGDVSNLTMQNVFDGRTSTLLIDHDRDPQTSPITVAEFFRTTPTVNTVTTGDGLVFLGQGFFNQNAEGRAKTMIHEGVVHKGFGRQDTDFGATQREGSLEINRRIDNAYRLYRPPANPQMIEIPQTVINTQIIPRLP